MRSFYSLFIKNMHPVKGTLWSGRRQLPGTVLFVFVFVLSVFAIGFCDAKVSSKIDCDDEEMRVEITGSHIREAYLKGLKNYPEPSCQPDRVSSDLLKFRLSLRDFYRCGTSQILNKITGSRTFYNHLIVETYDEDVEILLKCQQTGVVLSPVDSNHINATFRFRRDVLPAGFIEEEPIPYRDQIGHAPDPMLSMVVKQDGRTIGQELLVSPGAPLQMEVSLDPKSIDVYGIIMAQLEVTDTTDQSEAILLNACSVDPYLFENFVTTDGDLLTAKFRAFKFPDSNYVLFKGTVNVCLGICQPSQCSNGQIGYGRRRRSINNMGENYGLYEFQMNTVLRIANEDPSSPYSQERFILSRSRRLTNPDAAYRKDSIQAEYSTASQSCSRGLSNPIILIASLAFSLFLVNVARNAC